MVRSATGNGGRRLHRGVSFNKLKVIIVFLAESKIGIFTITNATAGAIRARLLARLAAVGVRESGIAGASQIIRKVAIVLEVAWITGCATYCGSVAAANGIADFGRAVGSVLVGVAEGAEVLGNAANQVLQQVFIMQIRVVRAMLDTSNWDTSPMGSGALVLRLLGKSIWSQISPDNPHDFLANLNRTLSSFNPPRAAIDEIEQTMTRVVNARGGLNAAPLAFIQYLVDWRLLRFTRDPQDIANAAIKR